VKRARKWLWEVWRDDCRIIYFPTLEAAERYAHCLFIGTPLQNTADMIAKGRERFAP